MIILTKKNFRKEYFGSVTKGKIKDKSKLQSFFLIGSWVELN